MNRVQVVRADPAGNITLFVLTPTEREERAALAGQLMALRETDAEQVAFACAPEPDVDGAMDMMGGEFCGNASRAYGMLLARQRGAVGRQTFRLRVSGCAAPVSVHVDTASGEAYASMPLPLSVQEVRDSGVSGTLVDMGGIVHLVTEAPPSADFLRRAEPLFLRTGTPDAYGVCFLEGERMTPLVKVPAAGTLVFESSCGSGALAAAAAMSRGLPDGEYSWSLRQPGGSVRTSVTLRGGEIAAASIGGGVTLGEPFWITLP